MSGEWYFAEGMIVAKSGAPLVFPDEHPDSGDYVLFLNPNKAEAHVELTFYYEDEPPAYDEVSVPGERVLQHPLHRKSKHVLKWNKYYGCRVRSNIPVICQRTRGEFIPNDPITNCMASFMMHPGPLGEREKRWAYADGIICWREDHPLVESEWVSILNPGSEEAHVEITAYHAPEDKEPSHLSVAVAPERLKVLKLDDMPWVVPYELFGLLLESDVPIVVEEVRRAYEKDHYDFARSLFNTLAFPGFELG